MSYILDALQRAEAERERGHVPSLHSPTGLPGGNPAPAARPLQPTVWLWIAGAAVVLTCAAAGAWWLNRPTVVPAAGPALATPDAASKVAVAPAPPAGTPSDMPSSTPVSASPEAAPALPILAPPAPPRAPAASTNPAAPVAPAVPASPAPAGGPKQPLSATNNRTARTAATAATAASASAATSEASIAQPTATPSTAAAPDRTAAAPNAPSPVRSWAELSAETRAQLPPVSVSGSTYSQNPAHRMLIVNGQVVQEGQPMAPGLVLESIGPRSAVLNQGGLRYSITY